MANREKYPSEAAERFQVRLPNGLRDRLRHAAEAHGRSMNSEIVLRLQNALDRQDDGTISVWIPKPILDRIYDEANRSEVDPNLLIVDAVEKAFPPKPNFKDQMRAMVEDADPNGMTAEEADVFFKAASKILGYPIEAVRSGRPPWKAPQS